MKQINSFYWINNKKEIDDLVTQLDERFGLVSPTYKHKPTKFPVLLTYSFTNDVNGASVLFKHITIEEVESLVTNLSPST